MRTRKSTAAAATAGAANPHADRVAKRRPDRSSGSSSSSSSSRVTRWTLSPEIAAEIGEIAAAAGCELIHAEWKGGVLRLVLDRPAGEIAPPASPVSPGSSAAEVTGVSLGDCEHVAKQTSALLDLLDFGNGRYLLEVSSPGLDRQLYRPCDYQRFLGRLARVTYEAAMPAHGANGVHGSSAADAADAVNPGPPRRRTVVARLAELHAPPGRPEAGEVTLIDDRTGERLTLRLEDIRLARLEVEL